MAQHEDLSLLLVAQPGFSTSRDGSGIPRRMSLSHRRHLHEKLGRNRADTPARLGERYRIGSMSADGSATPSKVGDSAQISKSLALEAVEKRPMDLIDYCNAALAKPFRWTWAGKPLRAA